MSYLILLMPDLIHQTALAVVQAARLFYFFVAAEENTIEVVNDVGVCIPSSQRSWLKVTDIG